VFTLETNVSPVVYRVSSREAEKEMLGRQDYLLESEVISLEADVKVDNAETALALN